MGTNDGLFYCEECWKQWSEESPPVPLPSSANNNNPKLIASVSNMEDEKTNMATTSNSTSVSNIISKLNKAKFTHRSSAKANANGLIIPGNGGLNGMLEPKLNSQNSYF